MLACPRCGSSYSRDQEFCGVDGERLVDQPFDPLVGRTIDRYRIVGALGDGGMARVYRARHIYLEQDVAIKVLFGDVASDRSLARRFQREAQAASRIKHPNVVTTIDFGATPEGLIFMAMELLEGRTLSDVLRSEGVMSKERAAGLVRQIAEGLGAAHALGFVHRDLKPKNVMLVGPYGGERLKILDFGLVLLTEPDANLEATNLTRQGQVFGTPAYMAPEQVAGNPVSGTADLYALGIILYQLLTGTVPFTGAAAQIAMHHLSTEPPPLPDHEGLGPIAMRLLEKDPRHRPQTAAEVVTLIDRLVAVWNIEILGVAAPELAGPLDGPLSSLPPMSVASEDEPAILSFFASDSSLKTDVTREVGPELERAALGERRGGVVLALSGAVAAAGLGLALYAGMVGAFEGGGGLGLVAAEDPRPVRHPETLEPPPARPPRSSAVAPRAGAPRAVDSRTAAARGAHPGPQIGPQPGPQTGPAAAPSEKEIAGMAPRERPVAAEKPAELPLAPSVEPPPLGPALLEPPGERGKLATRRDFERQDLHLAFVLSRRGLNWRDLASATPDAVEIWGLWRIGAEQPTLGLLEQRASALESEIARLRVDAPLLDAKLERVRKTLGELPETRKDARHDVLVQRYNSIRSRVIRARADDVKARLAQEITILESDASAHAGAGLAPVEPALERSVPAEVGVEAGDLDPTLSSTVTLKF